MFDKCDAFYPHCGQKISDSLEEAKRLMFDP